MKRLSWFLLIFLITTKSYSQDNLKKFYYQLGDKKQVKVYKFIDQNDSTRIFYWKVTFDPENFSIITDSYNTDFVKGDSFHEKFNRRGAIVKKYSIFEENMFGFLRERKAEITQNKVYQWKENSGKSYKYEVLYTDKYGKTRLTKSRAFGRLDSIEVKGKRYLAAIFKDDYNAELLERSDFYGFSQISYYVEGVGMIKYIRYIPGMTIEAELDDILTEEKFEKLKKNKK